MRMVIGEDPVPCWHGMTVARWTGHETRALREAMRLSVRAFAEYLGVGCRTVSKWEDRRRCVQPRPAMQSVLDRALTLADADARARFQSILRSSVTDRRADDLAEAEPGRLRDGERRSVESVIGVEGSGCAGVEFRLAGDHGQMPACL